jgi:hypothetical protein
MPLARPDFLVGDCRHMHIGVSIHGDRHKLMLTIHARS